MRSRLGLCVVCAVAVIAALPAAGAEAKTIKKTFSSGNVNLAVPEPFGIFAPDLVSTIKVSPGAGSRT